MITPLTGNPSLPNAKRFQTNAGPRFSSSVQLAKAFSKSTPLLKSLDYAVVGDTLLKQSMLIYTCIIGSRVAMARSTNERLEVLRRDPLGWYMWFMGKPLFEWGLLHLATINDPHVRSLLFNYKAPETTWGKVMSFVNPPAQYYSSTQKQLMQRYQQIKTQMLTQSTGVKQLKQLTRVFTKANNLIVLTSFVSLVLTILGLGIGINMVNIALTRRNVEKAKHLQDLKMQTEMTGGKLPALSSQIVRAQISVPPSQPGKPVIL